MSVLIRVGQRPASVREQTLVVIGLAILAVGRARYGPASTRSSGRSERTAATTSAEAL